MAAYANVKFPPPGAKGGDCTAVADRVHAIVKAAANAELGDMDANTRKMAEQAMDSELAKVRTQILEMCKAQNWPQVLKDCALTAADMQALQGCEQYVTDEMRAADAAGDDAGDDDGDVYDDGDGGDDDAPAAKPVPAWTGGDDCQAVGERVAQLAMAQLGDVPAEMKADVEGAMKEAITEVVNTCKAGKWSAEARGCFLKASTIEAAEDCFGKVGM
ncbi:MAG: hypothetical protein H6709_17975 [Kofleriaceae bacterium]|nr:hypothetical protein [Kofleriaceae bacterium]MCB9573973.1 hypothetical protein [Kofleriaceae bacterium]